MSLDLDHARASQLAEKLAPYSRYVLECTADHALKLFADEIVPEHLLTTMMADEECAAHHAVIFAFADPQTIGREALALSPGILVVSSSHSLPFSPQAVNALFRAREAAREAGAEAVDPSHLMAAAFDGLDEPLQAKLREVEFDRAALAAVGAESSAGAAKTISTEQALFASFGEESRRILGVACKLAKQNQRESISPAHILGACVQREPALATRAKLPAMRLNAAIGRADADASEPPPRAIPLDEPMLEFLEVLPEVEGGLSTLDLLRGLCLHGSTELLDILKRSRINPELIERLSASYKDPESAAG